MLKRCGVPGSECHKRAEAGDVEAIAKRSAEAIAAKFRGRIGYCGVPGQACCKRAEEGDVAAIEARDLSPRAAAGDEEAIAKREADAEADADPIRRLRGRVGYCGVPGQACYKRAEESDLVAIAARELDEEDEDLEEVVEDDEE